MHSPAAFAAPCGVLTTGATTSLFAAVGVCRTRSPSRPAAPRRSVLRASAAEPAAAAAVGGAAKLKAFIADAGALGTLRFVAVSGGAVLESIGRFDYGVKEFSVPGKGDYLTVASEDRTFECHLNLSIVKKVTMSDEPAKVGGHTLHVMRFCDEGGKPVLSVMLMWAPNEGPGVYLYGAVDAFGELRDKYGAEWSV